MKKLNKKGFTLAELLIVVAIIAVLTAIAVPLFTGALSSAEQNVKDANIRAVRSEAVAAILLAENGKDPHKVLTADSTRQGPFKVEATVSKSGAVSITSITKDTASGGTDQCIDDTEAASGNDKKYKVTVYLTVDDLKAASGK